MLVKKCKVWLNKTLMFVMDQLLFSYWEFLKVLKINYFNKGMSIRLHGKILNCTVWFICCNFISTLSFWYKRIFKT